MITPMRSEVVLELNERVAGAGPLVVLVHGTAPATWSGLPALLAGDFRVVDYDRAGFPPSPGAIGRPLRAHADDLAALIERHGGPAILVGWSIGGVIALDVALRHPEKVAGLVLLEGALHLKKRPTAAMLRGVLGAQVRGRKDSVEAARTFYRFALARSDGGPAETGRLGEDRVRAAAPAVVAELARGTGEAEIRQRQLADLRVPVEWLVGSASRREFAAAARRAVAAAPQIALVEVPGAGHAVQLDAPEAVVAAVRRCAEAARSGPA